MKRQSLLFLLLMALFAPLAMNAQPRNLKKKVSQAPRPQLQFEVAGQLQTIENFQAGKVYHRAEMNRDDVLYSNGFNSQDELSDISIYDYDGDGYNWGWYNGQGITGVTGDYALGSQSYTSSDGALTPDNFLIMPAIELPADNAQYFASIYAQSYGGYGETIGIFVAPEGDEYFYQVGSDFNLSTGDYELCEVNISDYAGQTIEIYIRHYNCTDGWYLFVDDFSITQHIPSECEAPSYLTANNITSNSAELSWTGFQDNYNLRYRPIDAPILEESFENGLPSTWMTIDNDGDGFNWENHINTGTGNFTTHTGDGCMVSASYDSDSGDALTPDNWLITPQVQLGGSMSFWAVGQDASWAAEHFQVYVSTRGTDIRNFVAISQEYVATANYTKYTVDLSTYSGNGYIAIRHYNVTDMFYLNIDDVTVFAPNTNPWNEVTTNRPSLLLESLTNSTEYEWQVQGICTSGETEWVAGPNFTTLNNNIFINNGNWNEPRNWYIGEVPADGSDVTINADCIIPADYFAIAGNITIGDEGSLTIQDGGQLIHTNEGVIATVEKEITPYTGQKDNYYLISTPVYDQDVYNDYGEDYKLAFPEDVTNMLENEYDLYDFDYSAELEWLNYKNDEFYLWQNQSYLYANSGDGSDKPVILSFTGVTTPALTDLDVLTGYYLNYTEDEYDFANWFLFGNPYLCNTYIWVYDATNTQLYSYDHYQLNEAGDEFIQSDDALAPVEGAFFVSEGASQYALVAIAESSLGKKSFGSSLKLNLTYNGKLIDAARIRFGEGKGMPKIQLNPNHTKVYFTNGNNDYAVVYTEAQGEMPVSFRAAENGNYTLSFNTENVELGYLHLIDNMTGKDVDLLSTPSYSFEASTTDYASRFKLVFATGNADDSFAFFSNGSFVINNEGNATLQVMDVTGRMISSENINGCANVNVNAAPGVYMIRLVNGENVKVQKVVVR